MKCDSWIFLLARTLASPCLGREPKARVATLRWGMVEVMHVVFLEAIKPTFATAPFIAVSVDEVTMIDNI